MKTFSEAVERGEVTPAEALALFDSLDAVGIDSMMGAWKGASFPTQHPLDGALEAFHWYGKRFETADDVHPLVFETLGGGTTSVNPLWALPLLPWLDRWPLPKASALGHLFQLGIVLFSTDRSCARLRMTTFRGKESATMIYDTLPINDVFRKVDDHTLLGLMDLKGATQPFFFLLHRQYPSQ
ncbi:DUF4334 domain-containing protein [Leptolyngbya sp. KIOST-1]|uniref:DUF4334 domain-containing protein n=1 Tax=Leptolyngbya sp. KIOST-1 TaxID=1229172 RepID=UPI00056D81BC|nr:DUF4334 domain-containing protein [Leptolyngbya sp. KIOST-1]